TVGVIASRVTTIGTTTSRVAAIGVTTRRVITVGGVGIGLAAVDVIVVTTSGLDDLDRGRRGGATGSRGDHELTQRRPCRHDQDVAEGAGLVAGHDVRRDRVAGGVDVGDGDLGGRREVGARDRHCLTDPNRRGVGEQSHLHVARLTVGVGAVAVAVVIGSVGPVTGSVATIGVTAIPAIGVAAARGIGTLGVATGRVAAVGVTLAALGHLDRGRRGDTGSGRGDDQLTQCGPRGHDEHVGETTRLVGAHPVGRHRGAVGVHVGDRDLAARREPCALDGQLVALAHRRRVGHHDGVDGAGLPVRVAAPGSVPSGSVPSGSAPSESSPDGSVPSGPSPSTSPLSASAPVGSSPSGSAPSGLPPTGSPPSGLPPVGSPPSASPPDGSAPSVSPPSVPPPSASRTSTVVVALPGPSVAPTVMAPRAVPRGATRTSVKPPSSSVVTACLATVTPSAST